jgi:UDP-N-acetylmuramoyl-tripeptide--D-alanyl-D-alanine ligase
MRMTAAEVAGHLDGRVEGSPEVVLTSAEVDSRRLSKGSLFVALPGARCDGHAFVGAALETAAAALVRQQAQLPSPPAGRALIRVMDPLQAYHRLARVENDRRRWQVVAITGSLGKTSSKDFLAHILAPHARTGASSGNRNSTLGLPAQLLSQPADVDIFVAEAGMSHPGELDTLGAILHPEILLYTRLAPVHTEFFPDMEGIVRAKGELLAHLDPAGTLIVNADDPRQQAWLAATSARHLTYGTTEADVRLEEVVDRGLLGSRFRLLAGDQRTAVELPLAGAHQRENLLAAAAAAWALGLSLEQIAAAATTLQAAQHRGRIQRLANGATVVDDCYNASPVAMAQLLDLLRSSDGRRVAVLGEMYELGHLAEAAHAELGQRAARSCDLLLAVGGTLARTLAESASNAGLAPHSIHHVADSAAAAELLAGLLQAHDVVLVKGSRGVGLEAVVQALAEDGVS